MGNSIELSINPQPIFSIEMMDKQEQQQKARAYWIRIYQQLGSISKAARHCGIARSTLQRWLKRLPQEGLLADHSRRPHKLARQKLDNETINLILEVRDVYRFGKIRIGSHLFQHHQLKISPSTIAGCWKSMTENYSNAIGNRKNLNVMPKTFPGKGFNWMFAK